VSRGLSLGFVIDNIFLISWGQPGQ